jgi:superoxide dismutase, Cu-Zn family
MLITALIFASSAHAATVGPKTVVLKGPAAEEIGTATLTPMVKGVKIVLELKKMSPGEHALHFHENGTCTGPSSILPVDILM